ncbi:MAG TPA: N-acetyltransferase [Geminicoccus sp.]|uniref:GNAT family N-acetyltransferase n=1 Tax=Geminicoccus sp. TaxID=2024832 RepID=UPI002BA8B50C|nr:N-acetyltransferase [Geminicoccus sp.]HWL66774.1 N-acetyltransferase [Geminicoccus sp.]
MDVAVRAERAGDEAAIAALITAAFATAPYRSGTEAAIVAELRRSGRLALSLVATAGAELVGHVACSPVTISDGSAGWFGLGPLAVASSWQRQGIGRALVEAGLEQLCQRKAAGCVVLGDPAYYRRFGFVADPALVLPGLPAEYFQVLRLTSDGAGGTVQFDPAFFTA